MTDHACTQEKIIGQMSATIIFFQESEKRRESREERMASAMETMAAQGESLKGLSLRVDKTERNTDNLYGRIRELEIKPGNEAEKVRVGFWTALIASAIAFVIGIFMKKGV